MTDLELGRLGYGTANLGNLHRAMSDDDAFAILDPAWEVGLRYFDTAPHYGLGLAERRLGAFLRTKPRDEFVVSTKVGRLLRANPAGTGGLDLANHYHVSDELTRVWDFSPDGIQASLDESLERLGLDDVELLYLHDPERHDLGLGIDVALPALAAIRESGQVSAVGVGSMVTDALLASAESGLVDLLMVAGRYTLAEQPVYPDVLPACRSNLVGIVNASIFNSGILASDSPGTDSRYEYGDVNPELLARVQEIAQLCRDFEVSLPTAALQYAGRDELVRSVVIGGSNPEQVRQNAERMAEPVPDALWDALVENGLVPA